MNEKFFRLDLAQKINDDKETKHYIIDPDQHKNWTPWEDYAPLVEAVEALNNVLPPPPGDDDLPPPPPM